MSDPPYFPQKATYGGGMPAEHVVAVVVFDGVKLLDVAGPGTGRGGAEAAIAHPPDSVDLHGVTPDCWHGRIRM
jgi:hypothetical protein